MANTFKSAMLDVTTTDLTTLITVPTANPGAAPPVSPTTAVVKSILVCNDSGSTTLLDVEVLRSSATFEVFKAKSIATNTTTELLEQPLVTLRTADVFDGGLLGIAVHPNFEQNNIFIREKKYRNYRVGFLIGTG